MAHEWFQTTLHVSALYALRRKSLPQHLLDDIRQEATLLLAHDLDRLAVSTPHQSSAPQNLRGWLGLVNLRNCLDAARKMRRFSTTSAMPFVVGIVESQRELEASLDLQDALFRLSDEDRELLLLMRDGESVREVADVRGVSQRTAYRLIKRAMSKVRRHLET